MDKLNIHLKSFGKLMHRMRNGNSIRTLAEQVGMAADYLSNVEAGRLHVDEWTARHILMKGFDLNSEDSARLILGVKLYDIGLRDGDIRQLVADTILRLAPDNVVEELRRIYRTYAE